MTWTVKSTGRMAPEDVVELVNRHRLMPMSTAEASFACVSLHDSESHEIVNDDGERVAVMFFRVDCGGASIDMIPIPRHFRAESEYRDDLRDCMRSVLGSIFASGNVRRATAFVPESRGRTRKALKAIGFIHEGRIRDGVHFRRKDAPEDLYVLGMTAADFAREYGDES